MYVNSRQPLKELSTGQKIVCGEDSSIKVLSGIRQTPGVLLVSSRVLKNPELNTQFEEMISEGWELLIAQTGEPKLTALIRNLPVYSSFRYTQRLVAIGGGSVIDEAKFISLALNAPEYLDQLNTSRRIRSPKSLLRTSLVAIPTTLGSGSESSSAGLMTNNRGEKTVLSGPEVLPELAVLDPKLLDDTPETVLAQSILDAIAHSIEGYLSTISNPGAAFQSKTALHSLLQHSVEAFSPNFEYMGELQIAGNMAGQVQDKMLVGPAHITAHYFSNIPHGLGTGYFLRNTCIYYQIFEHEIFNQLEFLLESIGHNFESLLKIIDFLLDKAIGQSAPFAEIEKPALESMSKDVAGIASPVQINQELIDRMWKIHEQSQS